MDGPRFGQSETKAMRRDAWASGVSSDGIVTNCGFVHTIDGIQLNPWNSADAPAAGIQLNSREFSWIPWIEKEKPGGFDQICYVSKSFVVKFTTTTEQYKRKRRWKNTNLDWTT